MKIEEAIAELRKEENKRKFSQSVDLIINLRGVDLKKDNIALVINLPHKFKDKKVCGFLNSKSSLVKTITKPEFAKYKDKKALKNLVKDYDFFIAAGPLMPSVATTFGKILGPAGKMPSPQLGIIMQESDSEIEKVLDKISKSLKIRAKETSIKLSIGKEDMPDNEIIENAKTVYGAIVNALPAKKENLKNVSLKLTMSKPVRLEL